MKINTQYLKRFVNIDINAPELKELLASIGIEVDEMMEHNGDDVFEVEITPNRPDWLSHYGIAREIYARRPELTLSPLDLFPIDGEIDKEPCPVTIKDSNDCGRFSSCIVRGVTIKPSSPEIQELLRGLGHNPINNIVDISNLVLMTNGHPNHIYDLDKLAGPGIIVRRAKKGEKLTLLDGQNIDLIEDYLVIADEEKPVGLGGIMGGFDTGVTGETVNILIECAYFDPVLVRKSSKKMDVRSDASYLFERGADIMDTQDTIRMILSLLKKDQQKELDITHYGDTFPLEYTPQHVLLKKNYPSHYSGINVPEKTSEQILENLGFELEDREDAWNVKVPSYRVDIYGIQDLVEEICRIHGYDNLESALPLSLNPHVHTDKKRELYIGIREHLVSIGFYEAVNYAFHSPVENERFIIPGDGRSFVEIKNPIGLDYSVMRNSLLAGLLRNTELNFNNSQSRVALFEFGRIFGARGNAIEEEEIIAISASGNYLEADWQTKKAKPFDFYIFKSLLETIFQRLFLTVSFQEKEFSFFNKETSLVLSVNGVEAGYAGEIHPGIRAVGKIEQPVFAAELKVKPILEALKENRFQQWNKYPATSRDLSFLIDKNIKYSQLEAVIEELKPDTLEEYQLTDVYEGKNIPAGKISFSMSFSYRSEEKTLVSEEVNTIHDAFTGRLMERLNLVQR